MHRNTNRISRRGLLRSAAAAAAGAAAAPYVLTSTALGAEGKPPASDRIVMGGIGIRSRGGSDLNWMMGEKDVQFVAICDVRRDQREKVKQLADRKYGNNDCKMYRDLREFLPSRPDIDGVLIATGERWHAMAATLAMKHGKDVYCEKPGSMTVAEGQGLVRAAKRYGRVFQTGTQRRSEANFIFAEQLARTGRLGKLHTLRAHIAPWNPILRHDWLPAETEPDRDVIDWDIWLGACPWRPFNMSYVNGGWRGFYDFHTGDVGEWGSHTICQCQGVMTEGMYPTEFIHPGNDDGEGLVAVYPNGVKLILNRKGWRGSCGATFEGDRGWAAAADGYSITDVSDPALLADFKTVVRDYVAETRRPLNHMRDLLDCIKTRRQPVANPVVSHRSMSIVHCANICLWLGRDLKWDPAREEFFNDDEANRLRSRAMRQPWHV